MAREKEEKNIEVDEGKKAFIPVIYVGPNVPGGALSQSTVFNNGYPVYVEEIKREHPEIEALFIPVHEYPNRMHELNSSTSPIRQAEKAFIKKFNNK